MSKYIFTLRKKGIEIELSSTDPHFIKRQMRAWQAALIPGLIETTSIKQTPAPVQKKVIPAVEEPAIFAEDIINENIQQPTVQLPEKESAEDIAAIEELDQTIAEAESMAQEMQIDIETEEELEEEPEITPMNLDQLIAPPIRPGLKPIVLEQPEEEEEELDLDQMMAEANILQDEITQVAEKEDAIMSDFDDITEDPVQHPEAEINIEKMMAEAQMTQEEITEETDEEDSLLEGFGTFADEEVHEADEEIDIEQMMQQAQTNQEQLNEEPVEEDSLLEGFGTFTDDKIEQAEDDIPDELNIEAMMAKARETSQQTDNYSDDALLAGFGDIEEEAEVRVTQAEESEEEKILDDDLDEMSSLLAEFEAETDASDKQETETTLTEDPDMAAQFAEEVVAQPQEDSTEEDFDSLISAMAEEMEQEPETEPIPESIPEPEPKEIPEAVQKIKQELEEKRNAVPIDAYFSSLNIKTPVDILLATASYLEKFEEKDKFTQKDISAGTMKAIKKPISPNIILAAVNKGYIEVVPDYTGTSESNEYCLTDTGKEYILKELS